MLAIGGWFLKFPMQCLGNFESRPMLIYWNERKEIVDPEKKQEELLRDEGAITRSVNKDWLRDLRVAWAFAPLAPTQEQEPVVEINCGWPAVMLAFGMKEKLTPQLREQMKDLPEEFVENRNTKQQERGNEYIHNVMPCGSGRSAKKASFLVELGTSNPEVAINELFDYFIKQSPGIKKTEFA